MTGPLEWPFPMSLQADDPKQAAKDILARAAARGIISGMPATDKGRRKSKSSTKAKDKSPSGKKKDKKGARGKGSKVSLVEPRLVSTAVFGSLRAVSSLSRKALAPKLSATLERLSTPASPPRAPASTYITPAHRVVVQHPAPFRWSPHSLPPGA